MRKKVVLLIMMAVALIALPAFAQNYGPEQPNAAFQSTSAMKGSGSTYSANPMLNNDGTATYNGASTTSTQNNGPRRAKKEDPITPDPSSKVPLGDALLPLALMSLAFCGVIYLRRRKNARV